MAEIKGDPVEQECLDKAHGKLNTCFAKLEDKGGCATVGDAADVGTAIDAFVGDVVTGLAPSDPDITRSKCAGAKMSCVGKAAAALFGCHAKAQVKGALDPKCTGKATTFLDGGSDAAKGCFEKLEKKYPVGEPDACPTYDDTAAFATAIAHTTVTVVCDLDPAGADVFRRLCDASHLHTGCRRPGVGARFRLGRIRT